MSESEFLRQYRFYGYQPKTEITYHCPTHGNVRVESFDVYEDPYHDHHFAVQVTRPDRTQIEYQSDEFEDWPDMIKKFLRLHHRLRGVNA